MTERRIVTTREQADLLAEQLRAQARAAIGDQAAAITAALREEHERRLRERRQLEQEVLDTFVCLRPAKTPGFWEACFLEWSIELSTAEAVRFMEVHGPPKEKTS